MFKKRMPAFTLIEMTVVLFIISLLILIVLPNLSAQRKGANKVNNHALQTELNTQAQLYMQAHNIDNPKNVHLKELQNEHYLSAAQVKKINAEGLKIDGTTE